MVANQSVINNNGKIKNLKTDLSFKYYYRLILLGNADNFYKMYIIVLLNG